MFNHSLLLGLLVVCCFSFITLHAQNPDELFKKSFLNELHPEHFQMDGLADQTDFAEGGWHFQNPYPTGVALSDVYFFRSASAIAVGQFGTIIRTTDGGSNWDVIESGLVDNFFSVDFATSTHGWIVGSEGVILHTTDEGASWTLQNPEVENDLFSVNFVNNSVGWVVGSDGLILHTTDGGDTWEPQSTDFTGVFNGVYFVDENTGWAVGGGGHVYHTDDGGDTWNSQNSTVNATLWSVYFFNANIGWISGSGGIILRTTDGGTTWTSIETPSGANMLSIHFATQFVGWAVGANGTVWKSTNGGLTWSAQSSDVILSMLLHSIHAIDVNNVTLVGQLGQIYRTTNSGTSWVSQRRSPVATNFLYSLFPVNEDILYVGGEGGVLKSTDSGVTWDTTFTSNDFFVDAYFHDEMNGIVAGGNGIIRKTGDGGETWTTITSGTNNILVSVDFYDEQHGLIGGLGGVMLRTTDGGDNWETMPTGISNGIWSVQYINEDVAWASGEGSTLIKTTDGGVNWESIDTGIPGNYFGMHFIDENTGWISGSDGLILKTEDAGDTWEELDSGMETILYRIRFVNNLFGITVGPGGTILYTRDGGESWELQRSRTERLLFGIAVLDHRTFWVTGEGATILHTNTGGLTDETPPSIVHTPVNSSNDGEELNITSEITDDTGIEYAHLHYRRGGEEDFTSDVMAMDGNTFSADIPADFVTSRGVEYYIEAEDFVGRTSTFPETGIVSVRVTVDDVLKSTAQPSGSEATAYRLVSLPIDANNKNPAVVWENVFETYDITKVRFFELRANQTYAEFPGTSPMDPGKAFWLIVAEPGKTLRTGQGTSVRTDQPFEISLHEGWTFIASPFNFEVPFGNLSLANGETVDLRTFNGSWSSHSGSLQPFAGYAAFAAEATTLLVDPDMSSAGTPRFVESPASPLSDNTAWGVQIVGESGKARDTDNWALVTPGASKEYDYYDRPNPPVIGEYVNVYFHRPEWDRTAVKYSTDARPVPSDGEMWDFKVRSNSTEMITLRFENIVTVPDEYQIWLLDERLNTLQDLRENNEYRYSNAGEEHAKEFVLLIGNEDYLDEQIDESRLIPDTYVLSQNFPNPFNPSTTIQFGLPEDNVVSIKVFDIMGRLVATLIDNEERRAGYHSVIWDAKDRSGLDVSSGTYFYYLRSGSHTQTKKMILLR